MKNRDLLHRLVQEFAAIEESAEVHARREARRLDGTPPGSAMVAASEHARAAHTELQKVADHVKLALEVPAAGALGRIVSFVRAHTEGMFIPEEKSYRMALLALREGIDAAQLLEHVAHEAGQHELVHFCVEWLKARRELVSSAAHALKWFAENPATAMKRPTTELVKQLRSGRVRQATKTLAAMV